jgi:hypothetical protein
MSGSSGWWPLKFWRRSSTPSLDTSELVAGAAALDDEVARFERSLEKPPTRTSVRRRRPRCRPPALKARLPKGPPKIRKGIPAGLSTIDCVQTVNLTTALLRLNILNGLRRGLRGLR